MRILLLAAIAASVTPVAAQVPAPRVFVSFQAGATSYDLSGTGSAPAAGLYVSVPAVGPLHVEVGSGFMRYSPQGGGGDQSILFPEVSARLMTDFRGVTTYVGAGAGIATVVGGGSGSDATLHLQLGLVFPVAPRVGIRADGRIRSVDPFTGTTADFTGGIAVGL